MGHNNYFQFKQFRIEQHKAAMRVNTDGVLLGAWVNLENAETVLDIGTGTGLIALMTAQRSEANITGVEIDVNAANEAMFNIANSPWLERIQIFHASFQDFAVTTNQKFDCIVTNPPFFSNSVKNTSPRLSIARHNYALPFAEIISGALKLLNPKGKLSIILPIEEASVFKTIAIESEFKLLRCTEVKPFPGEKPNRSLMEFGFEKADPELNELTIFNETKVHYSDEFKRLTRDFYLKL